MRCTVVNVTTYADILKIQTMKPQQCSVAMGDEFSLRTRTKERQLDLSINTKILTLHSAFASLKFLVSAVHRPQSAVCSQCLLKFG